MCLTRWERVYSVGMADFTREEVVDIAHKLEGADLRELDLRNTSLQGLNLTGADLSRADLSGADLRWAYLRWADLNGANLSEADLYMADLRGADLRYANLHGATYTANTKWPEGFDPEAAGAVLVEDRPAGSGCIIRVYCLIHA